MNVAVNRIMKRLIALLLCMFMSIAYAVDELMYWMVDETATVDGTSISTFLVDYPEDDTHWSAARIKVTGPGIGTRYLDNLQNWGSGWEAAFPAEEGVALSDAGDGRGMSTGNWATQSPLAFDGLSEELFTEAMFSVELGYITLDEVLDVVDWVTLAQTDPVAKSALTSYLYERGTLAPYPDGQWVPTTFHTSVPEPNTGLLILIGISMLALKRGVKA